MYTLHNSSNGSSPCDTDRRFDKEKAFLTTHPPGYGLPIVSCILPRLPYGCIPLVESGSTLRGRATSHWLPSGTAPPMSQRLCIPRTAMRYLHHTAGQPKLAACSGLWGIETNTAQSTVRLPRERVVDSGVTRSRPKSPTNSWPRPDDKRKHLGRLN